MKKPLLLALIICIACTFSFAQNDFKTKRITVFKDGTSVIEKTAIANTVNKSIGYKYLPIHLNAEAPNRNSYAAEDDRITLGSLRFTAENNQLLETIVNRSLNDSVLQQREYESVAELLNLNKGKKVKISQENGTKAVVGKIDKVADNVLILQSESGFSIISLQNIQNIEFVDKAVTEKKEYAHSLKPTISLDLKLLKDAKNQPINLSYLQRGITWLPTYFIDLYGQNKGKLVLEANLLNDTEDIENAEINFAVGVPSFAFKHVSDPLFSNKSVWEILRQLSQQQVQEFSQNIQMNMMTQRANFNEREANDDFQPQMEGVGGEDLYFYKKDGISLKRGGRMKTQILAMDFDYEDVYSTELEQNTVSRDYGTESKINKVWHSIRFKNNSKHPLTTGTVFFKKEDNGKIALVSQNQLDYTPENEFVTAKMTIAPDIMISSKDIETERKEIKYDYLLSIDGEIDVINYKAFPVDVIISRKIIGTMLDTDKPWDVLSNLETYNAKNTSNQVSWKLKVGAGKKVQIKYKYKILVD